MAQKYWTKRQVKDRFHVKSDATIWRWQRERGFPQGKSVGLRVLFNQAAVRQWEREQEQDQFTKGVSDGPRRRYNFDKAPADAAA